MLNNFFIEEHVKSALQEDIGFDDITTELTGFFAVRMFLKRFLKFFLQKLILNFILTTEMQLKKGIKLLIFQALQDIF